MYSSTDLKVTKLHERHPTAESTASPSTRTRPATMTSSVLYPVEVCGRRSPLARHTGSTTACVLCNSNDTCNSKRGSHTMAEGWQRGRERWPWERGGGAAAKGRGGGAPGGPPPQTLTPPSREGGGSLHGPLWGPSRWAAPN